MIHFAHFTSVYEPISTCDCSIFSHKISLSEILGQPTYRTWWKHDDSFCPTFDCFLHSSMFPSQWPSSYPVQPGSSTSVSAESIREHLVGHSCSGTQGFPEPRSHSQAWYHIRHLPPSCQCSHRNYRSPHSSQADIECRKYLQVQNLDHFRLDDSRFCWFGGHFILEFLPKAGPLQTKQVAMVIILTIWMQPHHLVEVLTRMLWWSLPYLKSIQQLSLACFGCEICSV